MAFRFGAVVTFQIVRIEIFQLQIRVDVCTSTVIEESSLDLMNFYLSH